MSDLAVFFGQALTVGVVTVLMVMALSVFFNRLPGDVPGVVGTSGGGFRR